MAGTGTTAAVWAAWRQGSPVVLDVPTPVRAWLLERYVAASMRNARLSLASFGLLVFALAYEVPLAWRLQAWASLAAVYALRVWRVRCWRRNFDPERPRSDPMYDALMLAASSVWGFMPWLLEGRLSPLNQMGVVYGGFVSLSLLAVTYLSALPAAILLVLLSAVPLVSYMALQGTLLMGGLAAGSFACIVALTARTVQGHQVLLQSLAAERRNAELVRELDIYRQALESENETLGRSLSDAAHAARRDPLTGAFNRRHMELHARALAPAVASGQEAVALCMIDIDHFKRVNDLHGHLVGDEALRSVAQVLERQIPEGGVLARLGGEEFLAVVRSAEPSAAEQLAEAMRASVAQTQLATEAGFVPVTVSIGVAQWGADEAFTDVMRRADHALYRAKHGGRNRVEVDSPGVHSDAAGQPSAQAPSPQGSRRVHEDGDEEPEVPPRSRSAVNGRPDLSRDSVQNT